MRNETVLVVDDRRRNAELFAQVLRMCGFDNEVVIARDGREALDYLFADGEHDGREAATLPRLVILDLHMPRMDGFEVLRRIRADELTSPLPVVVMSASCFPEDVAEAYRLGASGVVDKASFAVPFMELVRDIARYWLVINEPSPALPSARAERRREICHDRRPG